MPLTVSIVTPTYQHGHYIEQTIHSVLAQDYPFIEYMVVDGASTDNTLEILKRYENRLKWISRQDHGQADAINKGFASASGDIFAWLNSDDFYTLSAVGQVVEFFEAHPEAHFVYGDVIGLDRKGHEYGVRTHVRDRQKISANDFEVLVHQYDFLVQPACFWRASLWHAVGKLDITLRYAMDYEYWMRIAQHTKMHYLPVTLAYERLYGQAKTGSGAVERINEITQVAIRHGGTGLPHNYRAEAAAYYTVRALQQGLRGRFRAVRHDFASALSMRAPLRRYVLYTAVMLLMGQRAIPTAWLWLNRLRTMRQSSSKPAQPTSGESAPK